MYRRIEYILLMVLFICLSGCKSLLLTESEDDEATAMYRPGIFTEKLRNNNIADGALIINKISIKFDNGERTRRFRANLKYNGNDSIMISIRTLAGIEAARILIDKDSVRVNDRINKVYYTGVTKKLGKKYGLNPDRISLILGDFDLKKINARRIQCKNSTYRYVIERPPGFYEYSISCKDNKVDELKLIDDRGKLVARGEFKTFNEMEGKRYPEHIIWYFTDSNTILEMTIENLGLGGKVRMIFRQYPDYIKQILK